MAPPVVFEVSFEVCNKVGGIYAVIASKAAHMVNRYGEDYYTIGYFDAQKARVELEEQEPPPALKDVFATLESRDGIRCHYGTWTIPGKPKAILVDAGGYRDHLDGIKAGLWERHGVDSLGSDAWFDDPIVWSTAVGVLVEELSRTPAFAERDLLVHCHEWLAGGTILYLNDRNLAIATVFTTHATILGRSMASQDVDLYDLVNRGLANNEFADDSLAKSYGCLDKHTMERATAREATVFSTVSEITAKEAHYIDGKKVDIVLPNGLDANKYPDIEELSVARKRHRRTMRQFLAAYFNRYYYVDLDAIRSVFISGRFEYHNKGLDVFIQALGRLNDRLKGEKAETTVVAFIFIPTGVRGENVEVLKNVSLYEEMADRVDDEWPHLKERLLDSLARGSIPSSFEELVDDDFKKICKSMIVHFTSKKGGTPPLCAFELSYPESEDPILGELRANGLLNRKEDRVKVVYYPAYLSSADRLIPLSYDDATLTCDVGVFPSYYEPWGYTPLEVAAQGGLSITTDLAGFGRFIDGKGDGIYVLKREDRPWEDLVADLTAKLTEIVQLPKKERIRRRINAKELSYLADWKVLAEHYFSAHEMALTRD